MTNLDLEDLFDNARQAQMRLGAKTIAVYSTDEGRFLKCLREGCNKRYLPLEEDQAFCSDYCSFEFYSEDIRDSKTHLYRYFDAQNRLLYVGISIHALVRHVQHRTTARWFDQATRMTWETYPNRAEAEAAEIAAIKAEKPQYNIAHNTAVQAPAFLRRDPPQTNATLASDLPLAA